MRADVKKQDNGPESSTTVVELIVCQTQYDANLSLPPTSWTGSKNAELTVVPIC